MVLHDAAPPPTPTLSVSPASQSVGNGSGVFNATVTANVTWTVSTATGWITLSPASGSNNGSFTVNYTANTTASQRTGTVTVSGTGVASKTITVMQAAASTAYTITFNGNGGTPVTQTKTVTADQSYVFPSPNPAREGYTFAGWWTTSAASGGTQATTATPVTASHTLWARWAADTSPLPDFTIQSITLSPTSVAPGASMTATVTVKNQGAAGGNAKWLDLWIDRAAAAQIGEDGDDWGRIGELAAGAATNVTFTFNAPATAGAKTCRAFIDSADETQESNEANNQLTAVYSVTPAGAVHDFVFYTPGGRGDSFFLSDTPAGTTPVTTFRQGQAVYLSYAFMDYNGMSFSGVITNTFRIAGVSRYLYDEYTSLQSGHYGGPTASTEWSALKDLAPGTHTITATLNEGSVVPETNYANNTKSITFTVTAPPPPPPADTGSPSGSAVGPGAAPTATTAYAGFAHDGSGTVCGTVTLTAKESKGAWTFTAKAVLQGGSVSLSKKGGAPGGTLTLDGKSGEKMTVTLGADMLTGTLTGGKVGGTLRIAGSRDAFADKKDAAAGARLNAVRGYYTAALVGADGTAGYLTLTVGNGGSVKIAGKLADGTAVSGSAKLQEGLNKDGWLAIALHKPLYSKKGSVGGLLWLDPVTKVLRVDTDYGWFIDWTLADTSLRPLDVCGGWYGTGAVLAPSLSLWKMLLCCRFHGRSCP